MAEASSDRAGKLIILDINARQPGDEDGGDLPRLGESHRLTPDAVVLRSGRGFLEHGNDLVASAPGERPKIAFLACAGLIVGANPVINGDVSQIDPPRMPLAKYRCSASANRTPAQNPWKSNLDDAETIFAAISEPEELADVARLQELKPFQDALQADHELSAWAAGRRWAAGASCKDDGYACQIH